MNLKLKLLCISLLLVMNFFHLQALEYDTIRISDNLKIIKISENAYIHVSYSEFKGFGRVSSNGMIYKDKGKAFLFDTPATNEMTKTLVEWINDSLHAEIAGFVPNHWHDDCMGGIAYLQQIGVESYANRRTIEIAREKDLPEPKHGFTDSLTLMLNNKVIKCYYPGAGHSTDNIVVWIPSEEILFAGCMCKDAHAENLGNTADADLKAWPGTIDKLIRKFSNVQIVIPGHGSFGGPELLVHTKDLLLKSTSPELPIKNERKKRK